MNTGQGENRIAENALNFAKSEVDTATAQVDDVSRHFSDAIEKSREPETYVARYVALLKKATAAAPVGMLVTAFIAGALFAPRGHRR